MPQEIDAIFVFLSAQPVWWGLGVLFAATLIEYVFPPFPGDSIVLAGAVLIPKAGWPIWGVFGATLLGSIVGGGIAWMFGYWLSRSRDDGEPYFDWLSRPKVQRRIEWLTARFDKYGTAYIAVNRFIPAFRALFFVAAGLSRLALWRVLVFGAISAALWNAAILGTGYVVGYNLETLYRLFEQYSLVVLISLAIALGVWGIRRLWHSKETPPTD